jgi:hypothetical protein
MRKTSDMSRDPDNLYPTEPMETTLFYRSCRRAKMRRWEHIPSERRRERTVLVLCLLLILFFSVFNLRLEDDGFIGAPDGESGQTERDGRVEQYNNSTERGPQNNEGREGFLAALFSSFYFFFLLVRCVWAWEGGPWKANIPVGLAPALFDFWSLVLETELLHTHSKENNFLQSVCCFRLLLRYILYGGFLFITDSNGCWPKYSNHLLDTITNGEKG